MEHEVLDQDEKSWVHSQRGNKECKERLYSKEYIIIITLMIEMKT